MSSVVLVVLSWSAPDKFDADRHKPRRRRVFDAKNGLIVSLLMWEQTRDGFLVVTDTLATDPAGRPWAFQSKIWLLPEYGFAIAATGAAQLADRWYDLLRNAALVCDIETVDVLARVQLQLLWNDILEETGPGPSVTIHHFGVRESGEVVRYIYRSQTGFESERGVNPCFAIKPRPAIMPTDAPEDVSDIIALAIDVRAHADRAPLHERICIGGDLIFTQITANQIGCARGYRFPDYVEMWNAMVDLRMPAKD